MMEKHAQQQHGIVVMGTVQGNIYDIGKTLLATLLGVHGFEVHDLGRDITVETFIENAVAVNADIIGTSALLTTTKRCWHGWSRANGKNWDGSLRVSR